MTIHMEFNYFNYDRGPNTDKVSQGEAVRLQMLTCFLLR